MTMSKDEHKERQRVTKACDNCRKKKIKCDAKTDTCSSCELLQLPCLYLDPTKKRGPPKGAGRHIHAIEDRLNRVEALVGEATDEDPTTSPGGDLSARLSTDGSMPSPSLSKPSRRKSKTRSKDPKVSDKDLQSSQRHSPASSVLSEPIPSIQSFQSVDQIQQDALPQSSMLQDLSMESEPAQQQQKELPLLSQEFGSVHLFQQQPSLFQSQLMQQQQAFSPLPRSNSAPDLQLDSSQSPEMMSQAQVDGVQLNSSGPRLTRTELIRELNFPPFNSPSPILGSEHSGSDFTERTSVSDLLPNLGVDTPPIQDLDDLEEDMGHLTLDHRGHERYVGKSSPMFYNRRHWGGYAMRERDQPEARKFVDNPDLPSPETMTSLLNLYFKYVHPFAPVFVWSRFLKRLKTRDYSPSFLFLLNSVFALASRFSDDISLRTDPARPETVGIRFVDKAKAILDTLYDTPDMHCVGALVLLSYQQMGTGGGYRAWMFIGLSIRMAQHLGLNRDCDKLNPHMPILDREERNRVWWTCFVADRLVSAAFGRPQGINEHDVDAAYPEGIDEENIQLEYKLEGATSMLAGPTPHSEKNFVYLASLTRIMGRVMISLYSPLSKASSNTSASMTNPQPLEQLDRELTEWLLTLPPHLQFRSVRQEPGTFVCTLHMNFYTTLILLHRPYTHQSSASPRSDPAVSLSICTSAANNTIEMASNLMRTSDDNRRVPRLKCLLHNAVFIMFTAGIVHITNCTSTDPVLAASAKLRTVETLRCLSVIEDVWLSGKFCGNNVKRLVNVRNIELPCSVEGFKHTLLNSFNSAPTTNGGNIGYVDTTPIAPSVPKEQSYAFDVDQIMGYYKAPGTRHSEPMGRNSRHFSPTPYFSPASSHHAQNSIPTHPGLSHGHAPLPRRPRQAKNPSHSPGTSTSASFSSQGVGAVLPTTPTDSSFAPDTSYLNTSIMDPFAAPGSVSLANIQVQTPPLSTTLRSTQAQTPMTPSNPQMPLNMYPNPFASSLWSLPTSVVDNDEWMVYMQGGNSGGGVTSAGGSTANSAVPSLQRSSSQPGSVNGMDSRMFDLSAPVALLDQSNSHTRQVGAKANGGAHPFSQNVSQSDFLNTGANSGLGTTTAENINVILLEQQQPTSYSMATMSGSSATAPIAKDLMMNAPFSTQIVSMDDSMSQPAAALQSPLSHTQIHHRHAAAASTMQQQQPPVLASQLQQSSSEYNFYMGQPTSTNLPVVMQQPLITGQDWQY